MMDSALTWKLSFIGAKGTGKTTLINRFVYGIYSDQSPFKAQGEFIQKKLTCNIGDTDHPLSLLITEQDIDTLLLPKLKNSKIVGIVTDIRNIDTLYVAEEVVEKIIDDLKNINILLIGNKIDQKYAAQFWTDELSDLAKKSKCRYVMVSAKTGENTNSFLTDFCLSIYPKRANKITV